MTSSGVVSSGAAPPIAVMERNMVAACSPAARAEGVRRGQRRRDAQARCPRLVVVAADPGRDHRLFGPVVSLIEERAPGVQIVRAGLCALRARGPARYYGGEEEAARMLLAALAEEGLHGVRAGVADGPFTAEQAARFGTGGPVRVVPPGGAGAAGSGAAGSGVGGSGAGGSGPAGSGAGGPVRIVPPGGAGEFLAQLPVTVLGDAWSASGATDDLVGLLARLGVQTLADFAALEVERVRERFGDRGLRLHALAAGHDSRPVQPRIPPPELHREVAFEPPLELTDQVAFGMRIAADEFIARLGAHDLVCTELRVELAGERGERSERVWLHPASFDAAAVVDRVRWQLGEAQGGGVLASGVAHVRISPAAVDAASHHTPAIFGSGAEERVHHALSRVQAMLGHRGVVTSAIGGGRWLAERQVQVPWGDRAVVRHERARPWPGSLPDPLPTTVYPEPRLVEVSDATGTAVRIGDRGALSAPPAVLDADGRRRGIEAWAGPWPVSERGWDELRRRRAHRFQVVDGDGLAWLLIWEEGEWRAEGRYD
ncbi:DNA polymerase Y family protein [Microbacterium rhizomatis]